MVADPTLVAQVDVPTLVEQYREWFVKAAAFVAVLAGTYLVGRLLVVPSVVRAVRARNRKNPTLVSAVQLYLRVGFVVLGVPLAVAAAGFGGVVAGSAIVVAAATLALGVAGQDVIGNLVSGVFLVADPDFNVDDYIEWGDHAGTVERIGLRVTRVRTPANEVATVPNTDLATSSVSRPFSRDRYRVSERVTVGYDEDVDALADLLVDAALADDRVLADPAPTVDVTALGDTAVELAARFWVADPADVDVADVRSEFDARAKDRLLDEGVVVAPATPQDLSGRIAVEVAEAE